MKDTQITMIPKTPLRFMWFLGSAYPLLGFVSFLLVFLAETLGVLLVYVSSQLIDNFVLAESLAQQKEVLYFWGGLFLLASIGNAVFFRLSGYTAINWAIKFHKDGYNLLYTHLSRHGNTYFGDRFAGALSNKVSNAVDSSAGLTLQILWTFFSEFIGLAVTLILFFMIDVRIGATLLGAFLLVLVFNIFAARKRRPLVVAYAESSSKSRGEGVDVITNISAVRQFVQRTNEMGRLGDIFTERARKDLRQAFVGEHIMVANNLFAISMTTVTLVFLYVLLSEEAITAGTLVLLLGLLGRVGYMFTTVGQALNRFVRDYGNIEEGLKEILIPHEIEDSASATTLAITKGEVEWKDVLFTYGAQAVFQNFNLTIAPGQRLGLVGPSGAGKSTFVSLLLRQHDITGGTIMIDGQNISSVTQDSLRAAMAIVPQEPALFHRSIRENIMYGNPEASEAEMIEVAKKAEAHAFIMSLPMGYDTMVGERGVKLSGGQKQRVAIARAMLKNAPILILDEATSALDSESEAAIQKALHILMEGKTVIAIAHRLSTLKEMDRLIVLENGVITEDGKHSALATRGGTYQRLWEHQAGGFVGE